MEMSKNVLSQLEDQNEVRRGAFIRFVTAISVALLLIYSDLFCLQVPIFAFLVCPFMSICLVVPLLLQRIGFKNVLLSLIMGPPSVFLLAAVATPALGELHNQWVLREVRVWADELRLQKGSTGALPTSQKKFIHGYRAVFIDGKADGAPVILVDLFGATRESYSLTADQFLGRRDL